MYDDNSAISRAVFVAGLLTILTIAIFCWMSAAFRFEPKETVKGFCSPVIALELAKSAKEFVEIAGDKGDPNRIIIQKGIWVDYAFIAAYWAIFVWLGASQGVNILTLFCWASWLEHTQRVRLFLT
jgi:hypothetical protein